MGQSRSSSTSSNRKRRKKKGKQKVANFSKAVGLSPLQFLLAQALLLGVAGFIFFLGFADRSVPDSFDTAALNQAELLRQQAEVDERLKLLFKHRIADTDSFLLSIHQIQESDTEISDLEASCSLTPTQEEMVARIRLKNKGSTVLQMQKNGISYDAEKADLFRFCDSYKDASESDIYRECRFWRCAIPTIEFSYAPSEETLAKFSTAVEEYEDCYLSSLDNAELLKQILITMIKANRKTSELTKKGFREIAQRMLTSENKGVSITGEKLTLFGIFGEYDLSTLGYRIAWNDPSAVEDIEGAIRSLENKVKVVPLFVWDEIILAYESYLSTGNVKKVGAIWQRMWAISQQIQSKATKKQVQIKLQRQKHRATSIGSTFDLSGFRLTDGKPIDFGSSEYVAVIFVNEENDSIKIANKVVGGRILKDCDLHAVFAFKETRPQEDIRLINDSRGDFSVADLETSRKYHEELLVDLMPYIVLVDRSGKILISGLPVDQIQTRVAGQKVRSSVSLNVNP